MNLFTIFLILLALACMGASHYHAQRAKDFRDMADEFEQAFRILRMACNEFLEHRRRMAEASLIHDHSFCDNGADIEARMQQDAMHLDCPACGGSGHFDDTDDESLLTMTMQAFVEGIGASEDHELIRHHLTRLGLPDDLVETIMRRIAGVALSNRELDDIIEKLLPSYWAQGAVTQDLMRKAVRVAMGRETPSRVAADATRFQFILDHWWWGGATESEKARYGQALSENELRDAIDASMKERAAVTELKLGALA